MRNIIELPTHLTAGGQTSFPNALACAPPCFRGVCISELSAIIICPRATLQNVNIFIKIPCDRLKVLIKGLGIYLFIYLFNGC